MIFNARDLYRNASAAATLSMLILAAAPAQAADATFPTKPIRMLVAFAAGSGIDFFCRTVANKLQETFKLGVIVDNKAGAGGIIGHQELARATPDGHTIICSSMPTVSIMPATTPKLSYDPPRDFAPVAEVGSADLVLVTSAAHVPARSVREFVTWAENQKSVFFGTFGAGTVGHFSAFLFADATKLNIEMIHYKVNADGITGLIAGDIHAIFSPPTVAVGQVKAGKLRALATTGPTRMLMFPDVPTVREAGYQGLEFTAWYGIFAPAKTPDDILDRLNAEVVRVMQSPDVRTKLEDAGFRVTGTSRDEFTRMLRADAAQWAQVVKSTGFKSQD